MIGRDSSHGDSDEEKGDKNNPIYSGIGHLDEILRGPIESQLRIQRDAFILIRGKSGGHKLALGYNILLGGLMSAAEEATVLLFSFRDQHTDAERIAMACNRPSDYNVVKIEREMDSPALSDSDKKKSNKFREESYSVTVSKKTEPKTDKTSTLVIVTMRPGFLTVEEFLFAFEQYVLRYKPERVLFDNTNLLKTSFSELSKDGLLFAALIRFLKGHNILSIVIDVMGEGSDEVLSYGLVGMADYVLSTESFSDFVAKDLVYRETFRHFYPSAVRGRRFDVEDDMGKNRTKDAELSHGDIERLYYPIRISIPEDQTGDIASRRLFEVALSDLSKKSGDSTPIDFSVLTVTNVRNKVYTRSIHGITAVGKCEFESAKKENEVGAYLESLGLKDKRNILILFDLPRLISYAFDPASQHNSQAKSHREDDDE